MCLGCFDCRFGEGHRFPFEGGLCDLGLNWLGRQFLGLIAPLGCRDQKGNRLSRFQGGIDTQFVPAHQVGNGYAISAGKAGQSVTFAGF